MASQKEGSPSHHIAGRVGWSLVLSLSWEHLQMPDKQAGGPLSNGDFNKSRGQAGARWGHGHSAAMFFKGYSGCWGCGWSQ